MSECGKNFNVAIFSDIIYKIKVKLCMLVVLIELYTFIPLSVTLIVFHGRSMTHFPIWQKINCWLFHGHCSSQASQTLCYYNLAWGLPIHTRFDDLDLVSRSLVSQNNELQIVFFLDLCPP